MVSNPALPLLNLSNNGYGVGNLNDVKLKVPNVYLMTGISYQDEDIWSDKKRESKPNYQSSIADFTIILKLKDYQPAKTTFERERYLTFTQEKIPSLANMWLRISISPDQSISTDIQEPNRKIEGAFERWRKNGLDGKGFILQPNKQYDLAHYVARAPLEKDYDFQSDEFFYDSIGKQTFIRCSNGQASVAPYEPMVNCHHYFLIPELRAVVDVGYNNKEALLYWRETETKVRDVFLSFVQP